MRRRASRGLIALVVAVGVGACAPPCDQLCRKVRDCDLTPRLSQDECVESCQRQDAFYKVNDDKEGTEAYNAHRRCVMQASCDELHDGVCYDEDVFTF